MQRKQARATEHRSLEGTCLLRGQKSASRLCKALWGASHWRQHRQQRVSLCAGDPGGELRSPRGVPGVGVISAVFPHARQKRMFGQLEWTVTK